ncbi:MAG TPA: MFS transporter [Acidimicrobiales bacterium]|nr:MFS transporter [Acidimicrobiales bacterium]
MASPVTQGSLPTSPGGAPSGQGGSKQESNDDENGGDIKSLVPARVDRLNWSRFHTRLVIALGVAWVLDGLEITIAANVTDIISKKSALAMSSASVAFSVGTIYLLGEVAGALLFGHLADKWGRRKLFMITLGVYLLGGGLSAATAGHGEGWVLYLNCTRFLAGMGIGGEYAAINSAIDELIPARYRGRVDLGINGSYWAGALFATVLTLVVVNNLPASYSWRAVFILGPVLGAVILFVRRNLPESPRWLLMHGRTEEAEEAVAKMEELATHGNAGSLDDVDPSKAIVVRPADSIGYLALARQLFSEYPTRSVLSASLMITQSFLYNAIFFTYALVLTKIYHVPSTHTEYYFLFFCAGNFIGPLVIGRLFDTVGRRQMIAGTYVLSGLLLAASAYMFKAGDLTAVTQTAWWCVIFFFASAGASAAYLTCSEVFPLEVRAKAIAVFFCIAQSFGALGPWLYGKLIGTGSDHFLLFIGYMIGAAVMIAGGAVAAVFGVPAEMRSLEDIAKPLSVVKEKASAAVPRLSTGKQLPPLAPPHATPA